MYLLGVELQPSLLISILGRFNDFKKFNKNFYYCKLKNKTKTFVLALAYTKIIKPKSKLELIFITLRHPLNLMEG